MGGYLKEVNIKEDLPTAKTAVGRVSSHLQTGRTLGAGAVKIIHGYGSTGTGGKIRNSVRQHLEEQKKLGRIRDFIPGEQFSIFHEGTRLAFARCPELRQDRDLERHNNGMTVVVL
ncbi:MAG: hypothetical protein FWE12_00790 [Oscillospiraceae bacterium]|nr:hypothetical protein [Oscillospiraceae bacterium]